MTETDTPTRPLVRYHGGKWAMAPRLLALLPTHRSYIEPYGGGGSLLLRKERSHREVYNDLDGEMVNLFRVARDHGDDLRRRLELTPFARAEFEAAYKPTADLMERARRTVVRSFMGHGADGTCGRHKTGFRGQRGIDSKQPEHEWTTYPEALAIVTARLRSVILENLPAVQLMTKNDAEDTLFYVDPPYVLSTRTRPRGYKHEMTDADHREMAACLHDLKGMVVLSGYASTLYEELFKDWERTQFDVHGDGATDRTEVVWSNRAAWERRRHNDMHLNLTV